MINIKKNFKELNITINCNISNKNYKFIMELLDWLKLNKIIYPVVFSMVFDNKINDKFMIDNNDSIWFEVHKEAISRGYNYKPFYRDMYLGCSLTQANSYIISPDAKLYKCINAIDNSDYLVGSLDNQLTESFDNNLRKFQSYKINRKECYDCELYPICFGGCKYKNDLEGFECNKKLFYKNDIEIIKEIVNARN